MYLEPDNSSAPAIASAALLKRMSAQQSQFSVRSQGSPEIHRVQQYVADIFRDRHGAYIQSFLPTFVEMKINDQLSGAVGICAAEKTPLFLEQYLTRSAEQEISRIMCQPIDRGRVVEIGNLVATRRGGSYLLFAVLAATLYLAGFRWMLFTATEQVEHIIRKMSFKPTVLCEADQCCLRDQSTQWGNYYANKPKVMAGDLKIAHEILMSNPLLKALITPYRNTITQLANQLSNR